MVHGKAILDEKNLSPSQIIDNLTCCNNIVQVCNAVGFIDGIPVIFDFEPNDNKLEITCRDMQDTDKLHQRILDYLTDMERSNERIMARFYTHMHSYELRFRWKEENND